LRLGKKIQKRSRVKVKIGKRMMGMMKMREKILPIVNPLQRKK